MDPITNEEYEITVWIGTDFDLDIVVTEDDGSPSSLVGIVARGQIRRFVGSPVIAEFAFDIDIDAHTIKAMLDDSVTTDIPRGCVYDIEIVEGDIVTGLLHGPVRVIQGVTE